MNGFYHRDNFGNFLNSLKLLGEGAEVGCAFGGNSRKIMSQWGGRKLWMIDPWIAQDPKIYKERQEEPRAYDTWYEECKAFASELPGRVECIRDYSENAVHRFKNGSLDWVYLDGNHDYDHVKQDLELWFPKVKVGGVFSGHDYYNKTDEGYFNEVMSALDEWANKNNRAFERWTCSSWVMIK